MAGKAASRRTTDSQWSEPSARRRGAPTGGLGLGPLLAGGTARTGQLFGQRAAHEGLHAHVVPHAKLFQPTSDATGNSSRELDELFIVNGQFHAF